VEELQSRRKNLHMGMCKLLKEDLALLAEANSKPADGGAPSPDQVRIKERVTRDFGDRAREHEGVSVAAFNDDAEYKRLMNEAMDGKTHALDKMRVFLEAAAAAVGRPDLDAILHAPLADFGSPAAVLRLRTGLASFPWEAVVRERSADLDLGDWDAASASAQARELVAGALEGNANVRSVTIRGVKLALSDGWATTELKWGGDVMAAVKALPVTASLLLRICTSLSKLDIRCMPP
jgi:hypothetical protein